MELTQTAEQLAKRNIFNKNYAFKTADFIWGQPDNLNYEEEPVYKKMLVEKDLEIFKRYEKGFLEQDRTERPRMGDALLLPNGKYVYFCHIWDDHAQTCINGSFCLLNGSISHSGGLDSGLKISDITLTDKEHSVEVWFPHGGWLQAHCAIQAVAKTRVWRCKKDADLSGVIWEGKREEKY